MDFSNGKAVDRVSEVYTENEVRGKVEIRDNVHIDFSPPFFGEIVDVSCVGSSGAPIKNYFRNYAFVLCYLEKQYSYLVRTEISLEQLVKTVPLLNLC